MTRSLFLLLAGIYSAVLAVAMVFFTEASLKNYGVPTVDVTHISVMQFLGVATGAFGLLSLLNRNVPNSFSLRTILMAQGYVSLARVLLGIYHVYVFHVPFSAFFVGDTLFRLALGLGFVYFYNRESRQAQAGAVLA